METLIGTPLAALIVGILLQIALGRLLTPRAKGWLAFLSGLAAFLSTLYLIPFVVKGIALEATLFPWDHSIAWQVHVDGLSLVFSLMATGIGTAILFYCIDYMSHEAQGTTRFYALILTFIAGLVGLVFSANLLLAYLCWELIGLCSYFLVGFWYRQQAATDGARKVLIMTHLPGYGLLLGILLLFSWVSLVGLVRAEFLRGRNFEYIQAARALGVSNAVIMFRHLLPNAMVATMTFLPFILSGSVMTLTSLDFLGFGLADRFFQNLVGNSGQRPVDLLGV